MGHPYWPLFDVEVRSPRLVLRYVDDETAVALASLAAAGIHDPARMPFAVPWTDVSSPDLERNTLRWYWQTRAAVVPDSWNLPLAAFDDGELVGTTSLDATGFPIERSFGTGSWLGRLHQGRGLGTEMRVLTLHLGFLALDALAATTGAFVDNAASLAVTRKLGYEPNGIEPHEQRGALAEIHRFRMTRDHFLRQIRRDDVEISGDDGARELLGIERVSA